MGMPADVYGSLLGNRQQYICCVYMRISFLILRFTSFIAMYTDVLPYGPLFRGSMRRLRKTKRALATALLVDCRITHDFIHRTSPAPAIANGPTEQAGTAVRPRALARLGQATTLLTRRNWACFLWRKQLLKVAVGLGGARPTGV